MPPHANYAAVIGISQQVMQDMVRILYLANEIPHSFNPPAQGVPGLLEFNVDLFSDAPEFIFSSENGDSFILKITSWGPMTIALPRIQDGQMVLVSETREVKLEAVISVPHNITIENAELLFGIHADSATLVSNTVTVLSGGPFSQAAQNILDSVLFHNLLEEAIRRNLNSLGGNLPSIDINFLELMLGPIIDDEDNQVMLFTTARTLDGVLAIGIDMFWSGFGTGGNPDLLSDVTSGMGMGMWSNPWIWVPNMRDQLLEGTEETKGVRESVEDQGATLNNFDLTLREGYIHVSGRATKDPYGSANFSFDLYPKLIRPAQTIDLGPDEYGVPCTRYIPSREELWFDIQNITVDIDREGWVVFVEIIGGILTFGIGTLIVEAFVSMVRFNVTAAIAAADSTSGDNRTHVFSINEDGPPIMARIEAFEFHEYGVFMGLSLAPQYPIPRISGPTIVDINEVIRNTTFDYRIQMPHRVHEEDPKLRIRWTVRRTDNNSILYNLDEQAQAVQELSFSDIDNATGLKISCRVYRTLGEDIEDFYNGYLIVCFRDRLDRSHPYVRWYHYVYTPDVRVEEDGSHTILGGHIKYRISRIHRTDVPGRCLMVSRYSISKPARFRPSRAIGVEYLDQLPYRNAELNSHRHEICDYCFFGSPVNTQLLPLPTDD